MATPKKSTSLETYQRELLRDFLRRRARSIKAAGGFPVDASFGDMSLACWRRAGFPRLTPESFDAMIRGSEKWVEEELKAKLSEMRVYGMQPGVGGLMSWGQFAAATRGMDEDGFDRLIAKHLERWTRPGIDLPDDWAFIDRLAIAVATQTHPAWTPSWE